MATDAAEVATNQALRFANALRWERGQRKEGEERLEAANEVRCICVWAGGLGCACAELEGGLRRSLGRLAS
eukprot:COSAG02_NODE_1203_length_13900_cov_11.040287_17_plen_71_part_00